MTNGGSTKLEHVCSDPRGNPRFVFGSNASYVGLVNMPTLSAVLSTLSGNALPDSISGQVQALQVANIPHSIEWGGKGYRNDGTRTSQVWEGEPYASNVYNKVATIDGMEWFAAAGDKDYLFIQTDSSDFQGDASYIAELPAVAGTALDWYWIANTMSATRNYYNGVSIPAGVSTRFNENGTMEMSSSCDLSALVAKTGDDYILSDDTPHGKLKRDTEATIPMNSKYITTACMASGFDQGVNDKFRAVTGGQMYVIKPNLP